LAAYDNNVDAIHTFLAANAEDPLVDGWVIGETFSVINYD
jgi:hypothetical protein